MLAWQIKSVVLFFLHFVFISCGNRIYSTVMYDFIYFTSCFSFKGFLINKWNQKRSFNCEIIPRWVGLLVLADRNCSPDQIYLVISRRLMKLKACLELELSAWHMVGDVFSALFQWKCWKTWDFYVLCLLSIEILWWRWFSRTAEQPGLRSEEKI